MSYTCNFQVLALLYSTTLCFSKLMPWKKNLIFLICLSVIFGFKLCVSYRCYHSSFRWVSFRNYSLKGWPESWRLNARSWPASWSDASLARRREAWAASGTGSALPEASVLWVAARKELCLLPFKPSQGIGTLSQMWERKSEWPELRSTMFKRCPE